jgi:hypothetical protein
MFAMAQVKFPFELNVCRQLQRPINQANNNSEISVYQTRLKHVGGAARTAPLITNELIV